MAEGTRRGAWVWVVGGGFALGMLALGMVIASLALRPAPRFTPPHLPTPNGYDDLVRAGATSFGDEPKDLRTASVQELRAYVEPNRKALAIARAGLGREIGVPIVGTSVEAYTAHKIPLIQDLRKLMRLLAAESSLASKEGRLGEATAASLDLIRMGSALGRGGLILDNMIGQAATAMGIGGLRDLVERLDVDQCKALARDLEAIDRGREPAAETIRREQEFSWSVANWQMRLNLSFNPALKTLLKPALEATEFADKRTRTGLHLLTASLALRAYRLEHGDAPESLAALTPGILTAIPSDPFAANKGPLVYRSTNSGIFLYSVGPDGKDDGGTPVDKVVATAKGDLPLSQW